MEKTVLRRLVLWTFFAFSCLFVQNIQAMEFPEITAEELKSKIDNGEKFLLINPLSKIEYNAGHIPGSINIPLEFLLITKKLPKNHNQLIVTYCLGRKCFASIEAARLVAVRGYTNIMVFRDGLPGWKKAGFKINNTSMMTVEVSEIEPEQLNAALDKYLIVDVRTPSIYKFGYLPNSRAIPLPYLSMLSAELPKDRRIVVVDHSGKQSKIAAQWLLKNGFKDVSMLKDGLTAYAKAGFALEK